MSFLRVMCAAVWCAACSSGAQHRDLPGDVPQHLDFGVGEAVLANDLAAVDSATAVDGARVDVDAGSTAGPGPTTSWLVSAGGEQIDAVYSVACDSSGNVYLGGYFEGTASFGALKLVSGGQIDGFVAKLDASGKFLWAIRVGGAGVDVVRALAIDSTGSLVAVGHFVDAATFGPLQATADKSGQPFVARIDPLGGAVLAVWKLAVVGGTGVGVGATPAGDLVVVGSFPDRALFGATELKAVGSQDMYAARLDGVSGAAQWAISAGGNGVVSAMRAATDSQGATCVGGRLEGAAKFGNTSVTSAGSSDAFVARVSAGGVFLWAFAGGGLQQDNVAAVAADTTACFIGGYTDGPSAFGAIKLPSPGRRAFTTRVDATGFSWLASVTGAGNTTTTGIARDPTGKIAIAGQFQGAVLMGPFSLTASGKSDAFAARLSWNGYPQWLSGAGGTYIAGASAVAQSVTGSIHIGGSYWGALSSGASSMNAVGMSDVFSWALTETP